MVVCPRCGEHFDEVAHRAPEHRVGADPNREYARCPECGHEFPLEDA